MRLVTFRKHLSLLDERARKVEWVDAIERIGHIEAEIESGRLSGSRRASRLARNSILEALSAALDAHKVVLDVSNELTSRKKASRDGRRFVEEVEKDVRDMSSFIQKEAYEDEKIAFGLQLNRLRSEQDS